ENVFNYPHYYINVSLEFSELEIYGSSPDLKGKFFVFVNCSALKRYMEILFLIVEIGSVSKWV
ncbi:MAG: hypothetical protein ACPL1B_08350, partial [Thermoprotei archaeon]